MTVIIEKGKEIKDPISKIMTSITDPSVVSFIFDSRNFIKCKLMNQGSEDGVGDRWVLVEGGLKVQGVWERKEKYLKITCIRIFHI